MKLLVLGATGPTGRLIVDAALQCGDTVAVLARRPEVLGSLAGLVRVIAGDATSSSDVARAMTGQDAAVSALGRGRSVRARGLFTQAADAVLKAAERTSVSRLVWMSSFGVGDTYAFAHPLQRVMYSTVLRDIYADKKKSEEAIRSSGLAWTLVYPTTLTHGPARGTYRVDDRVKVKLVSRVSRADVAQFMHQAAHRPEWIHRDAVITD
ncbi:NAD(P)-binding oxidoreductase [Actinacidiphila glaucinigra]|uniref:NAD(P)-dependent oxidoreductase n=1 Tax=Actinacidiphila glaucinigra TaxID=235986 RepID=UPI00340FC9B6